MWWIQIIYQFLVLLHVIHGGYAHFLESVSGTVLSGNYSYFILDQAGFLGVELISEKGDCDIYLSQFEAKPTYEPNTYCLQSATSAVDKLIVPKSFKRPLSIGIYGHPSHEISTYTLNIYQIHMEMGTDYELDDIHLTSLYEHMNFMQQEEENYSLFHYVMKIIFIILELFSEAIYCIGHLFPVNGSNPLLTFLMNILQIVFI